MSLKFAAMLWFKEDGTFSGGGGGCLCYNFHQSGATSKQHPLRSQLLPNKKNIFKFVKKAA